MAISTLQGKSRPSVLMLVVYLLAVLGALLGIYYGIRIISGLDSLKPTADIKVEVLTGDADVYINDEFAGKTPYYSNEVKSGENKISIKQNENTYETEINFLENSEVVLNRDMGISQTFSSGQNFWVTKADSENVLSVISDVAGASVYIDGTAVGKTPYSSNSLSEGEYDLRVELSGYESQDARISIQKGYRLNVALNLFPMPVPQRIELLPDAENLYDLSSANTAAISDPSNWVRAVVYWNSTRGINLAGLGVNKDLVFDYYLDFAGKLYDKEGNLVTAPSEIATLVKDAKRGAYLGRKSDPVGLTKEARDALLAVDIVPGMAGGVKTAKILPTGTTWLRVRDQAGLNGTEVTRVDVDKEFPVLEETTGWVKIKVDATTEGWVSSKYVEINDPTNQ